MGNDEQNISNVVNYRLDRLEEAVAKLSALSDVIVRWDAKFSSQGTFMNCQVHAARMDAYDKKLEEIYKITVERTKGYLEIEQHEIAIKTIQEEVSAMKSFMNKAIGAMAVISIVIQLLGPIATDYIKGHAHAANPPVQVLDAGGGYHLDLSKASITNR